MGHQTADGGWASDEGDALVQRMLERTEEVTHVLMEKLERVGRDCQIRPAPLAQLVDTMRAWTQEAITEGWERGWQDARDEVKEALGGW